MQEILKRVPIPIGGVALGLAALGNLLEPIDERIRFLFGIVSAALLILLIAKIIKYPKMIREDLKNPILASVSTTSAMTLMQLSGYMADFSIMAAFCIWALAIIVHLTTIVWFSVRLIRNFRLDQVFPTYFVCYVGIIVGAATSPIFGLQAFGQILFWMGFASYIPLLAMITIRYAKHQVPDAAKPLFCIYSAPASLSIVGYLAVYPDPNQVFIAVLLACAQALYLIVLTQVPRFVSGGFFPSFAAMTFPFVITATALVQAVKFFSEAGIVFSSAIDVLMTAEVAFAITMVLFVVVRYIMFLLEPVLSREQTEDTEIALAE